MDYIINIDKFDGPLDLLLHLIKQSNIDIYDISIEEITNQYLDYINKQEELNINISSSYLVMAAELMEIKSKSLLPRNDIEETEEDEEVSKDNLIKKLIEYKKYKEITSTFKDLENERQKIYVKPPELISNYIDKEVVIEGENTVSDLMEAFKSFLERKELEKPITTKVTNKEYSVRLRRKDIKNILLEKKKVEFEELFNEYNKDFIIVTFISILEMAKENEIEVKQDKNFSKIYLELR